MRTITALFVGLGSIGTRHLKNLANLCADRGWALQADALRSDLSRPLRDGVAELLHAQYTDMSRAAARRFSSKSRFFLPSKPVLL